MEFYMKKNVFHDKVFWKALLRLALPIALQNLLTTSLSLIDTLMVGRLGDTAIAAVGIGSQIAFFCNIVMFGIASGGAVFVAQYWGNGDKDGISRAYVMMLLCNIPIALLFIAAAFTMPKTLIGLFTNDADVIAVGASYIRIACISYLGVALSQTCSIVLRSVEEVKLPFITSALSVAINTVLNYALIFGKFGCPQLGVDGAAYATSIAALIAPVLLLIMSRAKKNAVASNFRAGFRISKDFAKSFFKKSLPVLANESLWALGVMCYNAVFGHMGTDNYAALTIFRTVENISFVFFVGVCNACNVIVAKSIGAGDIDKAKTYAGRFMVIVPVMAVIIGAGVIALRGPILTLFNSDAYVKTTAAALLMIYGIEMGVRNIPYISIVGIFRAGGDTKTGMKFDLMCLWLFALPVTAILGLVFKIDFLIVYTVMLLCEDIPKNIMCIQRFRSMKWIQPVVAVENMEES